MKPKPKLRLISPRRLDRVGYLRTINCILKECDPNFAIVIMTDREGNMRWHAKGYYSNADVVSLLEGVKLNYWAKSRGIEIKEYED